MVETSDTSRTGSAGPWLNEIERARKARQSYDERCKKIHQLYTRQNTNEPTTGQRRFALLWANVQTLQPAVYARAPKAVVTRRFKDADPIARAASECVERALNYSLDADDFDTMMRAVRDDYLMFAMGTSWVRYEPETEMITPEIGVYRAPRQAEQSGVAAEQANDAEEWRREDTGEPLAGDVAVSTGEDGATYITGDTYEAIKAERCRLDYVHRDDFLHSPARFWSEVWWVARRSYLTRDEAKTRFGEEIGSKLSLDHKPTGTTDDADDTNHKATIYEIWSKRERKVYFVGPCYPDVLAEEEPFLDLSMFWPCPRPAFGTITNDSLIPVPDYVFYQDQAEEIDALTDKIATIQGQLRLLGFYPAGPSGDGSAAVRVAMEAVGADADMMIPIAGWSGFMEKGGAAGVIQWVPLAQVVQALTAAVELRQKLLEDVYQITGISDIQRGDTDPRETAAAQGLKNQWGSMRVRERQSELARFARDVLQIMGEVIAQKFTPETLSAMTGMKLVPPPELEAAAQSGDPQAQQALQQMQGVIELLRSNIMRGFRIDIETDSTVQIDEQEDKQSRVEFAGAFAQAFGQAQQSLQALPPQQAAIIAPTLGQGLLYLVRGFRAGRELEDGIEKMIDQLVESFQQAAQQPPQPNPEQQKAEMEGQRMQMEAQLKAQEAQMKMQALQAETEVRMRMLEQQLQALAAQTQAKVVGAQADIAKAQAMAANANAPREDAA